MVKLAGCPGALTFFSKPNSLKPKQKEVRKREEGRVLFDSMAMDSPAVQLKNTPVTRELLQKAGDPVYHFLCHCRHT